MGFGGICRETNKTFFIPIENKNEENLVHLIKLHVGLGTKILTDGFSSYQNLHEHGFQHESVNHSENFVDPITLTHTNTIESTWWAVKRSLRSSHTRKCNFSSHLAEYIWVKKHRDCMSNFFTIFERCCKTVSRKCVMCDNIF